MRGVDVVVAACVLTLGCERSSAPEARPTPTADASLAPSASSVAAESPGVDAGVDETMAAEYRRQCAALLTDPSPRRLVFRNPGDPSSHPGCTLLESGALQCAVDVPNWRPRSKVQVPPARAKQVLDEAMRQVQAAACAPCPHVPSPWDYPPGYDPQSYPAQLRNSAASVEVCGDQKEVLMALRKEFASTLTKESRDLSR